MRKKKTNPVEASLIEQLQVRGADIEVFKSLISDYMSLWNISESLKKDIVERGAIVSDYNSTGALVTKPNSSIKELRDTNKSMLMILKQLNLNVDNVKGEQEDDEL